MTSHLVCKVAYDGTAYFGWQKTKEGPSIEEEIEKAASTILQEKIILQAASRTDRGVHATGQVIDLFSSKTPPNLSRFWISMNQLLPDDIQIIRLIPSPHDRFHATLSSIKKKYTYKSIVGPVLPPQFLRTHWHVPHSIDEELLVHAATQVTGTHDFSSFTNARKGKSYSNTTRTLSTCSVLISPTDDYTEITVELEGDHFLYKMARTIVGTLFWIARGKLSLDILPNLFSLTARTSAGMTAPAHGLVLSEVFYKDNLWPCS